MKTLLSIKKIQTLKQLYGQTIEDEPTGQNPFFFPHLSGNVLLDNQYLILIIVTPHPRIITGTFQSVFCSLKDLTRKNKNKTSMCVSNWNN
jgi:hypothetical protein